MSTSHLPKADNYLDKTFIGYNSQQAAAYNKNRGQPYSHRLYEMIVQHHIRNEGQLDTLLDVGCGTGAVTRDLAPHFERAIGVDPSKEMISEATKIGGQTASGTTIQYEIGRAEELHKLSSVTECRVDLLVAGMAAHWFHMEDFWASAARMVKVGGTVALWTHSSYFCHPSTPNAVEVQKALSELEDDILGPYELPSIKISRDMYDNLTMPWDLEYPAEAFPQSSYTRFEWNRNGKLEASETDFFDRSEEVSLKEVGGGLGTASMVTEWRKANPEAVEAGNDCVDMTVRKVAAALGSASGDIDELKLRAGSATALLLFRRES